MRVLVTGGAGFVGSHVVDAYVAAGADVTVVDDLSTGRRANLNPDARLREIDIRSPELRQVFATARPDVVNHHAAQASVVASISDPEHDADVNIMGTLHLWALCREFGVRRIIFASTGGAIYGDPQRLPVDETDLPLPLSPYGISKLTGEIYLKYFAGSGITWAILRYANVYGPRQDPYGEAGVVAIFAHAMIDGRAPTIFGDGIQTRDFVYVEDVAQASLLAATVPTSGFANIATGVETSVNDVFRHLAEATKFRAQPQYAPARPGEVYRIALNPQRAAQWLGWRPRTPLGEGLRKTVEWFRTHARD